MKVLRFSEPCSGWLDIVFSADHDDYTIVASHAANDCIRDFVQAVIRILSGSTAENVRFLLEPDFASCALRRDGTNLRVSIQAPDANEPPVFEAVYPMVAFAKRLVFECNRLRPFCGRIGVWNLEYPVREVECLLATLQNAEPTAPNPARASWFQFRHRWRGVGEPER